VNENILPKLLLTMEQLTLEQAALIHSNKPYHGPIDKVRNISFQKGAEWQKEQYKQAKVLAIAALDGLANAPEREYERKALQRIIELLQD
jgi:hypothetical protein